MTLISATPDEVRTYLDVDMLEPELATIAGGAAAIVSVRRPQKIGPNQDAACIIRTGDESGILIVADGCGGMAGGEQAARIVIETLSGKIAAAAGGAQAMRGAILDGVDEAHRQILDLKIGAGSTLALAQIEANHLRPFHIGDSQILHVGGRGKVKLLTTSHSPVGYAVESGLLEEADAIDHEERHLVSNYLGCDGMHIEVGSSRSLAMRDAVLVASDGVLDNLLIDEIVGLVRAGPVQIAAAKIAGLAAQRMAEAKDGQPHKPDDLTLILFSHRPLPPPKKPRAKKAAAS